jgi:hypothetical protein
LHSRRIHSGVSHKHPLTENNQQKQNHHHNKTPNENTPSISEKSMIVANTPTIPDINHQSVEQHTNPSTNEPTNQGKTTK